MEEFNLCHLQASQGAPQDRLVRTRGRVGVLILAIDIDGRCAIMSHNQLYNSFLTIKVPSGYSIALPLIIKRPVPGIFGCESTRMIDSWCKKGRKLKYEQMTRQMVDTLKGVA